MFELFASAAVALTVFGCTGTQDCEKMIIFGSGCRNDPGSVCLFLTNPPVDNYQDGVICYADTCGGDIPTTVPEYGCLFECQKSPETKFPFCSINDGGYWICVTTGGDDESPDKYECSNVTACSDSLDLDFVSSIYLSGSCKKIETITEQKLPDEPAPTRTLSCPTIHQSDPLFHQAKIEALNCDQPSGCLTHSDLTTTQLATSTPFLCDNWVKTGSVSTTWTNCAAVDYYGVHTACRYNPSGLSHCPYLFTGSVTNYNCQRNNADHILRNCVEISSLAILYGCTSRPNDGGSTTVNACHSAPATISDTFNSIYVCYQDSSNKVMGCGSCALLAEPELSAPSDVKNCVALSGGKYSCETGSDTPSNSYTCSGSRTNCETYDSCTGCTIVTLSGYTDQLRYDCTGTAGPHWTSCSQTPTLGYDSKPFQCTSSYSGCNAFLGKLSCTASPVSRALYFCTSNPNGESNPLSVCVASSSTPTSGFSAYNCALASPIETNYRCISTSGVLLGCSGSIDPTNTGGCSSGNGSFWYCYQNPATFTYVYCIRLTTNGLPTLSTSCPSAIAPIDGLTSCSSSAGSYSYSCYEGLSTTLRYGCVRQKLFLCVKTPKGLIAVSDGCVEKPSVTAAPSGGFVAQSCSAQKESYFCIAHSGTLIECSSTTDPTGSSSCTTGTASFWYCYTNPGDSTYGYCVQLSTNTRNSLVSSCSATSPKDGSSGCLSAGSSSHNCYTGTDNKYYGCQAITR